METKRKKILYVITKSNFGGAQRYVYDCATHLDPNEFEVAVLLGGNGHLKKVLEEKKIRTISVPHLERDISLFKELRSFFALFSIIRTERPDILHINSSKGGGLGSLIGRILFIPRVIFTAHGWAFNEDRPLIQKIIIAFFHWLTVLFSHVTIAVSNKVRAQMIRAPFVSKKIRTIHLGFTKPNYQERDTARAFFEQKIGRSLKDTFVIGTIAELHPVKDYPTAIHAFSEFKKIQPHSVYIIMGDGAEKEKLQTLVSELHLENSIFFLGFVENAAQYMKGFDVFLLTSRSEALGYVLMEAGGANVPVIATHVGGIPEVIIPHAGLLAPQGDIQEISRMLISLYESPELRRECQVNLLSHIEQHFSLNTMLSETTSTYRI